MMSEDNNLKNYTTSDIEKYWKGQLSNGEMHALEKAALDDPFLADALEGYKHSLAPAVEISDLKEKLTERISASAKIVSINKKKFLWLKVAAAIIVIGGLGILAQQVFIQQNENNLAQVKTKENKSDDHAVVPAQPAFKDSTKNSPITLIPVNKKTDTIAKRDFANTKDKTSAVISDTVNPILTAIKPDNSKLNEVAVAAAAKQTETIKEEKKSAELIAKSDYETKAAAFEKDKLEDISAQRSKTANVIDKKSSGTFSFNNKFIYKVVDEQNNPVPFANVSNIRDNVGTYTDIKGMFNLISSDSVMDVQIKSLGYNSKNYRLTPAKTPGNLVLEEDAKARMNILANNRKVISSRTREETAELEEPEVGWDSYNTYVLNNIKIPEDLVMKKNSSEVELSFQVDKNGNPVNIKVTKTSNCKTCDDEAVRVLKEGPRWSRRGKKSKTSVAIAVDK